MRGAMSHSRNTKDLRHVATVLEREMVHHVPARYAVGVVGVGSRFFLAAPRFEADDERAARGALRSLVRVPHVLPAQLIYDIVLVLYAPAHVQRLEDRHFFRKSFSKFLLFQKKKEYFLSTFFSTFFFAFSRSHEGPRYVLGDLTTSCMSLTSKCTSLSAIDGAASCALDGEHERNDETQVAIARCQVPSRRSTGRPRRTCRIGRVGGSRCRATGRRFER